ncbi:MAG: type II toxin-antitoxin system RelE/ParE family toxin [Bacteroidia bacterium]
MKYSYSLHEEAFEEFQHAIEWYKERGKSNQYRTKIKEAIQAVRDNPFAWQVEEEDDRFRRYILKTFPYKIVYAVHKGDNHIYIIAIAPTRKKEGYWKKRAD